MSRALQQQRRSLTYDDQHSDEKIGLIYRSKVEEAQMKASLKREKDERTSSF